MEFLLQRFWHISVVREAEKYIKSTAVYSDSGEEIAMVFKVDVHDFVIREAYLRCLGGPGNMAERRIPLPGLVGVSAYLGSGSELRQGLNNIPGEGARSLVRSVVNETVTSLVQAETFLYRERGYTSLSDYSQAWDQFYAGSCRFYSNLDRTKVSWGDYIGDNIREVQLFDRFKSQQLYRNSAGNYLVTGTLVDSFHHMSTWLEIQGEGLQVVRAEGEIIRVPDDVCRESSRYLNNLKGIKLSGLRKKEMAELLGTGQGCVHFIDLIYDSVRTIGRYRELVTGPEAGQQLEEPK
jgi:hypothetical protein